MLVGGLNIGWESILEFSIKQGRFEQGTSTARLLPNMSAFSRTPQVFECALVSSTFARLIEYQLRRKSIDHFMVAICSPSLKPNFTSSSAFSCLAE